jgi:hypothetical protein
MLFLHIWKVNLRAAFAPRTGGPDHRYVAAAAHVKGKHAEASRHPSDRLGIERQGLTVNDVDNDTRQTGGPLDRRTLLKDASLLAGGAVAASMIGSGLAPAGSPRATRPVLQLRPTSATPVASPQVTPVDLGNYVPEYLTDTELTTLKAVLDRIFPADDLGPGANEMGVFVYIDRALGGRSAASLPQYQDGLPALDTAAGGDGFAAVDADQQDAILTDAEAGSLAGIPEGFFAILLQHTREGMFSDPMYGGNVNFSGWDFIGYPGVKLVWSAEDQAVGSTPKPEHISVQQYGGSAS